MNVQAAALGACLATAAVLAGQAAAQSPSPAKPDSPLPPFAYGQACFSGVYPHLASLSTSYSEAGIGAVVPWADRLWYVSYVAHKAGSGVGLYEIDPKLGIRRRPESIVGTHASRMIHRETNQLIIGPYLIDAEGSVRVFEDLVNERLTGTMRHLADPANKVYFQAMEGAFYEADLRTLKAEKLYDLTQTLSIGSRTHFKGAYTAQGRVVVANNSYFEDDQRNGFGRGRLAEWDGENWTILHRTAFCDVTTAAGIAPRDKDDSPLWANGWDRRSVILAVLCDGQWHTYRLPKGSQSYDQAWCTEWPRIRPVAPDRMILDMHGLYYSMSPEFRPGRAAGLVPMVSHLKMTPDFCPWQDRLVFAGNENSAMGQRHRTGGQPQCNLWFGTEEDLQRWGAPAGWGGPWLFDPVRAGEPSDPFLVHGFPHRVLHLATGERPAGATGLKRCTGQLDVAQLPAKLAGAAWVTVDRGSMEKPGRGYTFEVDRDAVVYLAVHDRGEPRLPGWERTDMTVEWTKGGTYTDAVYRRAFSKGRVEIPAHDGTNERDHYGVPHMAFVVAAEGGPVTITRLPKELGALAGKADVQEAAPAPGGVVFTLEIDAKGTGEWTKYRDIEVRRDGYAWNVLPEGLEAVWMRIIPNRDTVASAQFHFGLKEAAGAREEDRKVFHAIPIAAEPGPRISGVLLPFAERLWFLSHEEPAEGEAAKSGALYEIDKDVKFVRREESLPGVFNNRKMVGGLLSIGPHLIRDDGTVRTFEPLAGKHLVASIRHPGSKDKILFLSPAGKLLVGDLESLDIADGPDAAEKLGLADPGLSFKAGHTTGKTTILAAVGVLETPGVLAEWGGDAWRIIDRAHYAEVSNLGAMSEQVVAVGWDEASTILNVRAGGSWRKHRLPKASEDYPPPGVSLSPRIREVVTERMLFDAGGLFYEVSGLPYVWSVKPVATHGRHVPDYCSWRGLLVLAGASAAAEPDANFVRGSKDAGLWFGTVDDLWKLGKPRGVGGPWRDTPVVAGEPSDPYLAANFDRKRVELSHDADVPVRFTLEVDFTVQRNLWKPLKTVTVEPGEKAVFELPAGYSAHWIRAKTDRDCRATAWFVYE